MKTNDQRYIALAEDARFVVASRGPFQKDWLLGAESGMDFWARAEAFVAQKRVGEIDRELRFAALAPTQCIHLGLQYFCPRVPARSKETHSHVLARTPSHQF
jgi:hypothetical protein